MSSDRLKLKTIRDASAIAFGEFAAKFDKMTKKQLIEWLDKNASEWERAINPDIQNSRLKTKLSDRFSQILRDS